MKLKKKDYLIIFLCLVISIISGYFSNDLIIGTITLFTALANSYLASIGNKYTYAFGLVFCITYCYAGFINNLYGLVIFYILFFIPLQIIGFVNWNKNSKDDTVIVREFTLKNSIIITLSCVIGSIILSYLLYLIPTQQLPFLDSLSNIINVCANILMLLRFKECWWIWIFNNIVDLLIWITLFINKGDYSFMMLLVSIGYLLINIYGIIKWQIEAKKN